MFLMLILACDALSTPKCYSIDDTVTDLECPCRDVTYMMNWYSRATCRPDQTTHIEWEPTSTHRFENEDRVSGVISCICKPT
jgi:hypothetical protein